VVEAVHAAGGACIVTADHGNCDHMLNEDGSVNTAHSLNPVPFIVTAGAGGLDGPGILADSVLLSRSGMTRLVDRLEREGLLERDHCTADGRGCFAVLTGKGLEAVAEARRTHLGGVRERFLSQFAEEELRLLASFWDRVVPGASGLE
jgi:DNA-binding MarR family transcriptional regulator